MDKKLFLRVLSFAKPYGRFWPRYIMLIIPGMIFGILNFALILPVLDFIFGQVELVVEPVEFSLSFKYFKNIFYNLLYDANGLWGKKGTLVIICVAILIASLFSNLFKYLHKGYWFLCGCMF